MSKGLGKDANALVLIKSIVNAGESSASGLSFLRLCSNCSGETPDARFHPKLQEDQGNNCCQDVCTGMRQSCNELGRQATCTSPERKGSSQHLVRSQHASIASAPQVTSRHWQSQGPMTMQREVNAALEVHHF